MASDRGGKASGVTVDASGGLLTAAILREFAAGLARPVGRPKWRKWAELRGEERPARTLREAKRQKREGRLPV
jgi:hypothetical protein